MVSDIRHYRVSGAIGAIVAIGAFVLGCAPFSESLGDAPPVDARRSDDPTVPSTPASDGGTITPADAAAESSSDAATPSTPAPIGSPACPGAEGCERVVFVTSVAVQGSAINGVTGADAICNQLAGASNNPRVAGRTFIAWLSDDTRSPSTSLVHGTKAYVRPDGARIASDYTHLTSGGALEMPIEIDELGRTQSGTVWSATAPSGVRDGASCYDWSSKYGSGAQGAITATATLWTSASGTGGQGGSDYASGDCGTWNRLYCFEK